MFHRPIISEAKVGSVGLAELVGAFSYALDITEGQPAGHCVRSCWIGIHVGRALGLPPEELPRPLLYAAAQRPWLQQQRCPHLRALRSRRSGIQARPQDGRDEPCRNPSFRFRENGAWQQLRAPRGGGRKHSQERRRHRRRNDPDRAARAEQTLPDPFISPNPFATASTIWTNIGMGPVGRDICRARQSRYSPGLRCWRRSRMFSTPMPAAMPPLPRSGGVPAPGSTPGS